MKKKFDTLDEYTRKQRIGEMTKKEAVEYMQHRYDKLNTLFGISTLVLLVAVLLVIIAANNEDFCRYEQDDVMLLSQAVCSGQDAGEFITGKVNAGEQELIIWCEEGTIKYVEE